MSSSPPISSSIPKSGHEPKYEAKFAGDVQSKRVLYGLQASGLAAPMLGSDGGWLPPVRDVMREVMDAAGYQERLDMQQ